MARGDRLVAVRVPEELHVLINLYQMRYKIGSSGATVRRLLECHPALHEEAEVLYTLTSGGNAPQEGNRG